MKVLLAARLPRRITESLNAVGFAVLDAMGAEDDALALEIDRRDPDILVVRGAKVSRSMMERGSLKLIVRAGAGCDSIDLVSATEFGISVANCAGRNADAVAELAFGLMIALDRRIPDNVFDLRNGKWNKLKYSVGKGLRGRKIGLLGLGYVGRAMISPARAFGMSVGAWSRSLDPGQAAGLGIHHFASPADLAENSQIMSLHLPLTSETRGIVDSEILGKLPPGAYLINTARAELVDEEALLEAMENRQLLVGLDVYSREPPADAIEFTDKLGRNDSVYGTHHIGASTEQAQLAIADEVFRILQTFKNSNTVPNLVNRPAKKV
jgi:D-3-phosphoglycerate dehydrogenase